MKTTSRSLRWIAPGILLIALGGCAMGQHGMMGSPGPGGRGMGAAGGATPLMMDMQAMCEMHRASMAGKSPAQRQAMMQEFMKSAAPEMRGRMQAMHEQCS